MRISVVIPALNEEANIARAVSSAWQAGAAEVVVADGGSSDDTRSLAENRGATVVTCQPGRALQQNAGAVEATGDALLFLHADNALSPTCGEQITQFLHHKDRWGGAFRQSIEAPTAAFRWLELGNNARVKLRRSAYGDQGIFCRTDVFRELGGFEEVPLMEDVLLLKQLRRLSRPALLPGPIYVSPRRWQKKGIIRQTLLNWSILTRFALGATPEQLVARYRRHDK